MRESGISMEDIDRFYAAGAFGKHVSKESAITIGMYPDMDREPPHLRWKYVVRGSGKNSAGQNPNRRD